ncbi:MAG: hypothetical protein R2741_10310 [Methanolobus sp.]
MEVPVQENVLFQVNGNNCVNSFLLNSSMDILTQGNYEYDITSYLQSGSNTVTFYDYHAYLGLGDYTSRVANVEKYTGTEVLLNHIHLTRTCQQGI